MSRNKHEEVMGTSERYLSLAILVTVGWTRRGANAEKAPDCRTLLLMKSATPSRPQPVKTFEFCSPSTYLVALRNFKTLQITLLTKIRRRESGPYAAMKA
jgi:hypothetical protein